MPEEHAWTDGISEDELIPAKWPDSADEGLHGDCHQRTEVQVRMLTTCTCCLFSKCSAESRLPDQAVFVLPAQAHVPVSIPPRSSIDPYRSREAHGLE